MSPLHGSTAPRLPKEASPNPLPSNNNETVPAPPVDCFGAFKAMEDLFESSSTGGRLRIDLRGIARNQQAAAANRQAVHLFGEQGIEMNNSAVDVPLLLTAPGGHQTRWEE